MGLETALRGEGLSSEQVPLSLACWSLRAALSGPPGVPKVRRDGTPTQTRALLCLPVHLPARGLPTAAGGQPSSPRASPLSSPPPRPRALVREEVSHGLSFLCLLFLTAPQTSVARPHARLSPVGKGDAGLGAGGEGMLGQRDPAALSLASRPETVGRALN